MDLLSAINADQSDAPKKAPAEVGDLLGGIDGTDEFIPKWWPHYNGSGKLDKNGNPYPDQPTGLQGRVISREMVPAFSAKNPDVPEVVMEHTDGTKWRVNGDLKGIRDEINRRDPKPSDLWAIKHLGEKPPKERGMKPFQKFGSVDPIRGHFAS